jgi:hypothetical protein
VLQQLSIYWCWIFYVVHVNKNKWTCFLFLIKMAIEILINNLPWRLGRSKLSTEGQMVAATGTCHPLRSSLWRHGDRTEGALRRLDTRCVSSGGGIKVYGEVKMDLWLRGGGTTRNSGWSRLLWWTLGVPMRLVNVEMKLNFIVSVGVWTAGP